LKGLESLDPNAAVDLSNLSSHLRDFKKEVKIMRHLSHPNIVQLLGVCVEPPNLCIVTEYLTNGSLEDVLNKMEKQGGKKFSLRKIVSLAKDIARGLNWLHHKGIIHRDLKTANILLDAQFRCKIGDFGLSHVKKGAGNTGGFYGCAGTPSYSNTNNNTHTHTHTHTHTVLSNPALVIEL